MFPHYFMIFLFAMTGSLSVWAALCNWEWFFHSQNTQWIIKRFGRYWARLFYGIIGIGLIGTSVWLLTLHL